VLPSGAPPSRSGPGLAPAGRWAGRSCASDFGWGLSGASREHRTFRLSDVKDDALLHHLQGRDPSVARVASAWIKYASTKSCCLAESGARCCVVTTASPRLAGRTEAREVLGLCLGRCSARCAGTWKRERRRAVCVPWSDPLRLRPEVWREGRGDGPLRGRCAHACSCSAAFATRDERCVTGHGSRDTPSTASGAEA
jgi:hypothetical protein